jgi:hypothetical protein
MGPGWMAGLGPAYTIIIIIKKQKKNKNSKGHFKEIS